MKSPADNVPSQRPLFQRILIRSWEYRHLRFWARSRIVAGMALTFCGALTLSYDYYWLAALFLVPAALNFAFGYWELAIARSASA
jgi:hypothetical protein